MLLNLVMATSSTRYKRTLKCRILVSINKRIDVTIQNFSSSYDVMLILGRKFVFSNLKEIRTVFPISSSLSPSLCIPVPFCLSLIFSQGVHFKWSYFFKRPEYFPFKRIAAFMRVSVTLVETAIKLAVKKKKQVALIMLIIALQFDMTALFNM